MAELPKPESEEKLISEKISVSDHVNGFHYTADKNSENFVIDMESFSNGGDNSRIKLQRNLSRKSCQRGSENKNVDDSADSTLVGPSLRGSCTPEKPSTVRAVGTNIDHGISPQVHHQITITASNITTASANDGRSILRRNSFKRSSSWVLDPRKIVFAFATLSSMGTILLIYLTLSISKYGTEENALDWQQQ